MFDFLKFDIKNSCSHEIENSKMEVFKELNELGFPVDDPYGLAEAFWTIFTKPKKETAK